jgi:hypothetical protein
LIEVAEKGHFDKAETEFIYQLEKRSQQLEPQYLNYESRKAVWSTHKKSPEELYNFNQVENFKQLLPEDAKFELLGEINSRA